jgi:hypothetical protein
MKESEIQLLICDWIKIQHPNILFTCDLASGMKLTIGQAVKAKRMRSSRGFPDIMIFEPRVKYKGLFLELKKDDKNIFKKNGEPYNEHIKEQIRILSILKCKGYYADFAYGFEDALGIISTYLSL